MKRTIDLDQVRVVQADNYKGNSCVYLEIMDVQVLFAYTGEIAASNRYGYYVTDGVVDCEGMAEVFREALARHYRKVLAEEIEGLMYVFTDAPEREIDYVKPRMEEESEY